MQTNIIKVMEGETATDLADPEDFKMLAVLRNTQVFFCIAILFFCMGRIPSFETRRFVHLE